MKKIIGVINWIFRANCQFSRVLLESLAFSGFLFRFQQPGISLDGGGGISREVAIMKNAVLLGGILTLAGPLPAWAQDGTPLAAGLFKKGLGIPGLTPSLPPPGIPGGLSLMGGKPVCMGFAGMAGCFGSPPFPAPGPFSCFHGSFGSPSCLGTLPSGGCFGSFSGFCPPGPFSPAPRTPFLPGLGGSHPSLFPPVLGGCIGCTTLPQTIVPRQYYTGWNKFPERSFFHRHLFIATRSGYTELTWIFYPDRPGVFFLFDPGEKVFLGKYRLGVGREHCFALLLPEDRKPRLRDIADRVYRQWGPLPRLIDVGGIGHQQVRRPPEDLPGEELPPDEPLP